MLLLFYRRYLLLARDSPVDLSSLLTGVARMAATHQNNKTDTDGWIRLCPHTVWLAGGIKWVSCRNTARQQAVPRERCRSCGAAALPRAAYT